MQLSINNLKFDHKQAHLIKNISLYCIVISQPISVKSSAVCRYNLWLHIPLFINGKLYLEHVRSSKLTDIYMSPQILPEYLARCTDRRLEYVFE